MKKKSMAEMAKAIIAALKGRKTLSISKLREREEVVDLDSDEFNELIQKLEADGVITPFGEAKSRYTVDEDLLNKLTEPAEAKDEAPAKEPDATPEPQKAKVKLTRLERVMAKIAEAPVTKLTDAERALAVDQAFAKMTDTVVEANKAIAALSEKTDLVSADIDLFDIIRVMPENGRGTGGARVTYSAGTGRRGAKVLVDVPWDNPTRKGLAKAIKRVEDRVFAAIERMADYVIRNSKV